MSDGLELPRDRKARKRLEGVDPLEIESDILEEGAFSDFTGAVKEYKDESMTESPFTVETSGLGRKALDKIHESRSERAQTVDEKQNAPVTLDEEKWVENKNRYDYPGVDTIPAGRQQRRAERAGRVALEFGAADRVEQKGSAKNLQGKFSPDRSSTYGGGENVARVQGTANRPERTLAHEVGHAFDYSVEGGRYGLSERLFREPDDASERNKLEEQAIKISERGRGDFKGQQSYRRKHAELTADLFAQATIEPRATKREAPELFDRFESIAEEEGFDDVIPDPLEADPEPEGFLD
jgi:hypothetical protein